MYSKNQAVDSYAFRKKALTELRKKILFEAACFTMVDPQTLLSTGAVTDERVEQIHARLFENEYLTNDYNNYTTLAKSVSPIATLSQATNGDLTRSPRYKEILLPAGFGDELRAALIHEGKCWGFLTLFRSTAQATFTNNELKQLLMMLPSMARSLQKVALTCPTSVKDHPLESGIIIVNDNFTIISTNIAGESLLQWLREKEQIDPSILPRPIRAICSQAKANAINPHQETVEAKLYMRMMDGTFLSIQASQLHSTTSQFAVMSERAKPHEVLTFLLDSFGLSTREKQLVEKLLHGYSTKKVAEVLSISVYTVQDHLKSIFAKTGVSSRRELIWLVLSQYSFPN